MRHAITTFGFLVCVAAITGACGVRTPALDPPSPLPTTPEPSPTSPPAPAPTPELRSDDCALIAEPGEPIATIALSERVDPSNAPRPRNESERWLFRQLYETLVRVDCSGRVRPGLASAWRLDANGRTWIVTLRENAQFSDGTPATSNDVRVSWSDAGVGDVLRPDVSRLVESIAAIDDRTLAVTLRRQRGDVPLALAHTDLAIAKPAGDSRWPFGTRPDRAAPARGASGAAGSAITLDRADLPSLRFLIAPGDPRDLLDKGVDLLLTRDPAALGYAATLPQFQAVPLEWQRVHVLVAHSRPPWFSESARQALAGDAVRGEARRAMGPFWWEMLQDCAVAPYTPETYDGPVVPRVVYDVSDHVARDLAERLVALNLSQRPNQYQRPSGLTGAALAATRWRGHDAAYIVSLDRRPLDPCREIQALMDGVPWLNPSAIVPLAETRLHAIVRRGRSGITVEWDGGLLIAGAAGAR
jgi:hypothetical protein